MGLFSSKKVEVHAATAHLMEMNPDADKDAVLYAIFKQQSIPRTLINSRLSGLNLKVDAARNYAKDEYTLGLPSETKSTSGVVDDVLVAAAITEELNLPYGCIIEAQYTTVINALALAFPYLMDTRGIGLGSGEIFIIPPGWDTEENIPSEYLLKPTLKDFYVYQAKLLTNTVEITYRVNVSYESFVGDSGESTFTNIDESLYLNEWVEYIPVPAGIEEGAEYYVASYREITDAEGTVSPERHL